MSPEKLLCRVRKVPVAATPEEQVRQLLLQQMVDQLGYPSGNIAVEKELSQMPHLEGDRRKFPKRRADIVCFTANLSPLYPLYPLLLVECKSTPITAEVMSQVIGYNHTLKAIFIAVANQSETIIGWYSPSEGSYQFLSYLPLYEELKKTASNIFYTEKAQ